MFPMQLYGWITRFVLTLDVDSTSAFLSDGNKPHMILYINKQTGSNEQCIYE